MPERPDYKVYRSRPRLLPGRGGDGSPLDELRRAEPGRDGGDGRGGRGGSGSGAPPGRRRRRFGRVTPLRVLAGFVLGIVLWLAITAVAFVVSSTTAPHSNAAAKAALDHGSSGLTSPTITLVLGSDARPPGSKEPGADPGGPQRSDTIMLLRSGGGVARKLSIPRDTLVNIPGHGLSKINAAYAYGGAALTIQTIKQYLGIPINHLIEVNFEHFPKLIDAMGGIDYTGPCVVSLINGGKRNGGYTLRLKRGTHHLDGQAALALARTRKNQCRPSEDDRTRVRRQQQILSAMKSRVMSPAGFARAPWIAWQTPRAIKTDLSGPSLVSFMGGMAVSGNAPTAVLLGTPTPAGSLQVSDADRQAAVRAFMSG
jgi:LCP family protein required for cell wall assembly